MTQRLHFQLDPRSGVPVYRQLMDQMKYYVAAGTLRAGDQLPSIRELAQTLAVNPTTIVKAYTELEHEDVIGMRQGKGAFVAENAGGMSLHERQNALRRLARQLAIEARQMGAPDSEVVQLVEEELALIQAELLATEAPVKLSAVNKP